MVLGEGAHGFGLGGRAVYGFGGGRLWVFVGGVSVFGGVHLFRRPPDYSSNLCPPKTFAI